MKRIYHIRNKGPSDCFLYKKINSNEDEPKFKYILKANHDLFFEDFVPADSLICESVDDGHADIRIFEIDD